jgi:arsenical pump membrane protein
MHMDYFLIFVFLLQIFLIIYLSIKKPYLKIAGFSFESYALMSFMGPIILLFAGYMSIESLTDLTAGITNPVNIVVFFLSMVFISVYLDEVGFIEFCARMALKWAGKSTLKLFIYLYTVVSLLTLFTSNDIIILTFTPFIYYFSKNAGIDPKPFLFAEFFAANTWSIAIQFSNPTNIYISTNYSITFLEYWKVMWLPQLVSGLANILIIYLLFKNSFVKKIMPHKDNPLDAIRDPAGAIFGVILLTIATVFLSISDYVNVQMWEIALYSAIILFIFIVGKSAFSTKRRTLKRVLWKMPWSIIPFVFSFFFLVKELADSGLTSEVANWLASFGSSNAAIIYSYGISSAFASNILNNIPMSVAYTQVMAGLSGDSLRAAIYATTVGSNIGAFFTPIGALAGIMWMDILKSKKIDITYVDFVKYGTIVGLVTLLAALVTLIFTLNWI